MPALSPQGRYCLVANYETGSLCVLPIRKDGSLGEATDTVQFSGSGPNADRQEGPHAHMVTPSPVREADAQHHGNFILAVDLGTDRLMAFRLDQERGTLSPAATPWTQLPPGAGPRHLAFHPHRPLAYVINELQSTITVCCYDGQQGEFAPLQTVSTLPDGFTGENLGAEIMVAPSGRFVYASNRGHDSVAIFAVGPATGQLSLVGHESTHGSWPPHVHHRSNRHAAAGGKPGYGHRGHILDQPRGRNVTANRTRGCSANAGLPPTV